MRFIIAFSLLMTVFGAQASDKDLKTIHVNCMKNLSRHALQQRKKICDCYIANLKVNTSDAHLSIRARAITDAIVQEQMLEDTPDMNALRQYDAEVAGACLKDPNVKFDKSHSDRKKYENHP